MYICYFPTVSEPSLFIRPIVSPRRQCGVTDLYPEAGSTGNVISLGESSVFIRCRHLDRRLWDAICFPEKSGFTLWEAQEIPKKELMNMKDTA